MHDSTLASTAFPFGKGPVQAQKTTPAPAASIPCLAIGVLPMQVHTFYEAVGLMVGAEGDMAKREEYLGRLMAPPNATWQQIIAQVC